MRVDLFDFELPEELIALRPASPRESARLLQVTPGASPPLADRTVADLPELLRAGDMLVFNDTRVLPAALEGLRIRNGISARVSLNLIKRIDAATWRAFARPAKKLERGDTVHFPEPGDPAGAPAPSMHDVLVHGAAPASFPVLSAKVAAKLEAGEVELIFDLAGPALDTALAAAGRMPLPPYIALKRPPDTADITDYQTIFAARDGAVAAPTAALHFTPALMELLSARGVSHRFVTLHVGAGTFLPVKANDTSEHKMHSEWGEVSVDTVAAINTTRARGGRIIAAGTTSLRILESAAQKTGRVAPFSGETDIFITPGYTFRAVDGLVTNFHLPRSTLFMLASAFSGIDTMKEAYAHAIAQRYRFYSYGDASLLWPSTINS